MPNPPDEPPTSRAMTVQTPRLSIVEQAELVKRTILDLETMIRSANDAVRSLVLTIAQATETIRDLHVVISNVEKLGG
jgi:hypothetical protein